LKTENRFCGTEMNVNFKREGKNGGVRIAGPNTGNDMFRCRAVPRRVHDAKEPAFETLRLVDPSVRHHIAGVSWNRAPFRAIWSVLTGTSLILNF
jgi:hypothetical protein